MQCIATLQLAGADLLLSKAPLGGVHMGASHHAKLAIESGRPAPAVCKVTTAACLLQPDPSGAMRHPCRGPVSRMRRWQQWCR